MTQTDDARSGQAAALPWQKEQWQRWLEMRQRKRIPNALLLDGIGDIGKALFARAVVEHLLCDNGHGEQKACGRCRSCEMNRLRTHPDLMDIRPIKERGPIGIDRIRDALEFLTSASHQSSWRCVIMDPAEAMNVNAANALLKNLEEPGAKTLFALVSDNPGWLPATIRSRCSKLAFYPPDSSLAREWLTQQAADATLLDISGGRPLRALRLSADSEACRERLARLESGWCGLLNDEHSSLEIAGQWKDSDPMEILDWMGETLLGALKWRVAPALLELSREDLSRRTGERLPEEELFVIWNDLLQARRRLIAQTNPNPELLLGDLLAQTAAAARKERRRQAKAQ